MKEIFRQAAARYRPWLPLYYYARSKVALDPAYAATVELLRDSARPLLDLGCGIGLLAVGLRLAGHRAKIIGVDLDEKKIAVARTVLANEEVELVHGNVLEYPDHSGDVVILDMLHYLNDDEQQALLHRVAASVAPGGMAVMRVALRERNWRFALTCMGEWISHVSRWLPANGWNFPTHAEVSRSFLEAGLAEEQRPMWGLIPFTSYLFIFRRPQA